MSRLKMLKPSIKMANPLLKTLAITRNPDAIQRTRGRAWMTRRASWLRKHPLCVMCESEGRAVPATDLDHIIPLIDGGADDESNYQSLCRDHHKAKSAVEASARSSR